MLVGMTMYSPVSIVQALRDLRWLILAPPMLNKDYSFFKGQVFEFSTQERAQNLQWLSVQDSNPAPLVDWLATKPLAHLNRLGRYAEHLLEYFLRFGPTHHLVAANIALRYEAADRQGDHTTRGEIDYLLTDGAHTYWHWELAVKYFLVRDVPNPSPHDLVGPDSVEVFAYKLEKMFERQMCHPKPPPYDLIAWQVAAFTRGWIFYPRHFKEGPLPFLHHKHLRGFWLEHSQLDQLPEGAYQILNRQRWLSEALVLNDISSPLTRAELVDAIQLDWFTDSRPPSGVSRGDGDSLGDSIDSEHDCQRDGSSWYEQERFFVMPNRWSAGHRGTSP
jgi:uncharacterized protein